MTWKENATAHERIMKTEQDDISSHTFYGQNVATSTRLFSSLSPTHSETESMSDLDSSQTGRFTADFATPKHKLSAYPFASERVASTSASDLAIIPHNFNPKPQHKILVHNTHIEPWVHSSFIPLAEYVYQYLYQVDTVELPKRPEFEGSLLRVVDSLIDPLRETAVFSVEKYKQVAHALGTGDLLQLSEGTRFWLSIHRICSGSDKYSAILVPRDSVFEMDVPTADGHRRQFVTDLLNRNTDIDSMQVRLPCSTPHQWHEWLTAATRYTTMIASRYCTRYTIF